MNKKSMLLAFLHIVFLIISFFESTIIVSYTSAPPSILKLQAYPEELIDLNNPLTTVWIEFYPDFSGNLYHLASWEDVNMDAHLSSNDLVDIEDEYGVISFWYAVDVSITLHLTNTGPDPPGPEGPEPQKYIESVGEYMDPWPDSLVISTLWHEIYPCYACWWHIIGFQDNGDGFISVDDWVQVSSGFWYYVSGVATGLTLGELTPPAVSVQSPQNTTYLFSDIPLTFTVNETTSWMGYSLDNQANVTISGNTTLTDLSDGSHNVVIYANDTHGNMGASSEVSFTVAVPPAISILFPENASYLVSDVPLTFIVDETTDWVSYSLDDHANVTITGNTTLSSLAEGLHNIVVYANDTHGNMGSSIRVCFTIDLTPPTISILSPGNTTYLVSDIPLTVTVNELTSWMGYSLNGQINTTIIGNSTLVGLSNGTHSVVFYANDTAGNAGNSDIIYFTVDALPPGPCSVSIWPSTATIQKGQTISLYVVITNITGCAGSQFQIDYDDAVLEFTGFTFDTNPANPLSPTQIAPAPEDRVDTDVSVPGSVLIATVWKTGVPTYSGSGVAGEITLKALTVGNSTQVFDQSLTKACDTIGDDILFAEFNDGFVHVPNSPPGAPVVDISPNIPVTTDLLLCSITIPSTDLEGDPITYFYEWYKNETLQPTLTTSVVSSSETSVGDVWKCVVTPFDGTENGTSAEDQVTISESAQVEIPLEGDQNAIAESNVTLTDAFATENTLNFDMSGPSGSMGWVNVTFPMVNTTEIRVFVGELEITPPPFPIITSNGTHYFIYLELTLSTHEITIQYAPAFNIAVTNVTTSKTVVYEGIGLDINATIQNQGDFIATFNITAYANIAIIGIVTDVALTGGNSTTITVSWNTMGVTYGNYIISVAATPTLGETNTTDNTFTDGWVLVTIPGDVNGDRRVDVIDQRLVQLAMFTVPGHPDWDANSDVDSNLRVDVIDQRLQQLHMFESW